VAVPWCLLRQVVAASVSPQPDTTTRETSTHSGAPPDQRIGVLVDFYASVLRQGEAWGFDDAKLATLLGLAKSTHEAAVSHRMTLDASFRWFCDALLRHSVQRCAVGWACLHCGVEGAGRLAVLFRDDGPATHTGCHHSFTCSGAPTTPGHPLALACFIEAMSAAS